MMLRILAVGGGLLALAMATSATARPQPAAKHPDFTGLWTTASLTNLERPEDLKTLTLTEAQAQAYEKAHRGKPPDFPPGEDIVGGATSEWWETDVGLARIRGQIRSSWLIAPADGQLPITKEAKALFKARRARRKAAIDNPEDREPSERCIATDGAGPPLANGGYNDNLEIVQAGDELAIHSEWMSSLRIVHIGRTQHLPPDIRLASGDSIGRWEGDVLVIDTTNFSPRDVDSPKGDTRADMHTIERLSRLSPTQLLYSFSVTNPAVFSQTWQGEMVIETTKGPLYEYACHEGNYSLGNILRAARDGRQ
jgi:hypothetical protein